MRGSNYIQGKLVFTMKFVYICSPLSGDIERNIRKANGYCRFAVTKSVVPLAPHAMFSGFLDDTIPQERVSGLTLGLEILKHCNEVWVFGERISEGMKAEIQEAEELGVPIQYFDERCEQRKAR